MLDVEVMLEWWRSRATELFASRSILREAVGVLKQLSYVGRWREEIATSILVMMVWDGVGCFHVQRCPF